ncbi:MAG: putative bifunctional diguanylate cyclase/phosphodiesterase, partial [Janthinobacterium lividum]
RAPDNEGVQFRLLAEMIPQLVWRSRDDGQWDWAGPQWHAFTGQSEGASLGLGWEDMVHPDDKAMTEHAWHAASSRGKLEVEHRLRRADGTYRWFQTRALPLQDHDRVTRHWFGTSTDVDDLRRAEERALFLAHHDSLTGAANRIGLQRALERTAADGEQGDDPCSLIYVDLDRFKAVNDQHGHSVGDELLRQVAARLRGCLGPGDLLARIGGDEFVVVQRGGKPEEAKRLAMELAAALLGEFIVRDQALRVRASIGTASRPHDGQTSEELLRRADLALYRAKDRGGSCIQPYDAAIEAELHDRYVLERDLTRAVEQDELKVHYQPVFDVTTGALHGFEALARWTHPERGSITPDVFIPLAEGSRLIVALGAAVLKRACQAAASWGGTTRIAVNLSPAQFRHDDVPSLVALTLALTGLSPDRLELEVTEGLLMEDGTQVHKALGALRQLGVRLVLDDFGAGYSSLGYLCRFAFDKVKVDRSFVRMMEGDASARAVVTAVVALGHSLKLQVTAEGVETDAQLAMLRDMECDLVQGFLLGKPMTRCEASRAYHLAE